MSIKTKVALGMVFLFAVILIIGGLALFYINELSADSRNIIRNNYESLHYTKDILSKMNQHSMGVMDSINQSISKQERNVTEPSERELTIELRNTFEIVKANPSDIAHRSKLINVAVAIQQVNLLAIIRKNDIAQETSSRASSYVIIIVTLFSIIAFTFIVNFPGYIANPIIQLTTGIKSIANKNYEERLRFDRKDEFEELADAFNQMAEKMDEYEHSNLAKVMFEKKRIEAIINQMTDPVIGLDEQNKIVFANDQALTLLHLPQEQLLGRYAPDAAVENDLLRTLIRNDKENSSTRQPIKIVTAGKQNYFFKENIIIRHKPTGEKKEELIGQVILLKNVTPFKELDMAKTNFIATISHELKTPIATLQMCAKLLVDKRVGTLNPEQEGILQALGDEVTRLSKLTHELLDISQIETGNIKLDIKNTPAKDVVHFAVESVKFQAERKKVKLEIQMQDNDSVILADADKTIWVLVNFLTNALRVSAENSKIIVKCITRNDIVKFELEDFGPGIEKQYLPRLFDKFFQIPGTVTGTGLGLAISKEFIEAQGGTIHVESTVGKGTSFSFELKRAEMPQLS